MRKKKPEEVAANARPALQEYISEDQEQNSLIQGGLQSPHNGNMLRNGFGRNNNNMRNMHGGKYALFDYASESFNPYAGGGEEHYIGYHPA
ncbi:hypothetical protein PVNG_06207 [Plasmodium vivax North Korean]|uniref:Uncharacterized protein n=1 Tax=Plasmodium vivax North Korean TaxID=1035514 RepID=A0A0J9TYT0_PLAVI|nr:hypothetical protein PVNG_06207 [Plasmodium vivax North Korean]